MDKYRPHKTGSLYRLP